MSLAQPQAREAPKKKVPKGSPLPRNRWSRLFLALKAGLAAGLALAFDHLTGNPDHVSSTFIAVVCVSPVVLIGLRRARDQVMGSAIGGTCGTLAALAGLSPELGIPIAVSVGVLLCFAAGFGEGYLLASFAALFVQAVPFGSPIPTLGIRGLAVCTGALSGLVINVLVSALAYRSIFTRRLRDAESAVAHLIQQALEQGLGVARSGLPYLLGLSQELDAARQELELRKDPAEWADALRDRLQCLVQLLRLMLELEDQARYHDLPPSAATEALKRAIREASTATDHSRAAERPNDSEARARPDWDEPPGFKAAAERLGRLVQQAGLSQRVWSGEIVDDRMDSTHSAGRAGRS